MRKAYAFTVSQPARYLNDFQTLGFNADERGRRVIDGILNWIGGGSGVGINYRFAQTGRTERNRQNHRYPEAPFPFAYPKLKDHLTGKVGGRGVACAGGDDDHDDHDRDDGRNTCPKALEVNSANEYWVKAGSLLHTDTRGRDLKDPKNVRFYLLSSVEHTVSGSPPTPGTCQQIRNTTDPNPGLRALFVALDLWVTSGVKPPKSEVPTRGTGAFSNPVGNGVGVVPQAVLGWPDIPGVAYSGVITCGISSTSVPLRRRYHGHHRGFLGRSIVFVSKVDATATISRNGCVRRDATTGGRCAARVGGGREAGTWTAANLGSGYHSRLGR